MERYGKVSDKWQVDVKAFLKSNLAFSYLVFWLCAK
jgi:hypothetical protein